MAGSHTHSHTPLSTSLPAEQRAQGHRVGSQGEASREGGQSARDNTVLVFVNTASRPLLASSQTALCCPSPTSLTASSAIQSAPSFAVYHALARSH